MCSASDHLLRNAEGFVRFDRLDRHTGSHRAEERKLEGARGRFGWQNLDRATLVVAPLDVAFALEVREVLMDSRERVVAELLGDLLEAWRETVLLRVSREVV